MYHQREHLTSVTILLVAMLLQGCAAAPMPVGQVSTLPAGVQLARQGAAGTEILFHESGVYAFIYPGGSFFVDPTRQLTWDRLLSLMDGRFDWTDSSATARWMVENGWRSVSPSLSVVARIAGGTIADLSGWAVVPAEMLQERVLQ